MTVSEAIAAPSADPGKAAIPASGSAQAASLSRLLDRETHTPQSHLFWR